MKPILYTETETEFTTNGIGILSDAIDCTVIQALNGAYELEMTYPICGIHFAEIQRRRIIMAKPDPVSQTQPFRIYRISKPMRGTATVYARHLAYDMMGIPVAPFSAEGVGAALITMKNHAVVSCPFTFWTDKATASAITTVIPMAMWSLLGGTEGSLLVYPSAMERTLRACNKRKTAPAATPECTLTGPARRENMWNCRKRS